MASIKGQALTNFIAKFASASNLDMEMKPVEPPTYSLLVDGSSRKKGVRAGVLLVSP